MGSYTLVRDKVPLLLEKWEHEPVMWTSVKDYPHLTQGIYVSKLGKEFKKLMKSFGEDNPKATVELMAEVIDLFEAITDKCFQIPFSNIKEIQIMKEIEEGKYENQMLLWEE